MKIIRFLDTSGQERFGERVDEHTVRLIAGDIFSRFQVTDETTAVKKLVPSNEKDRFRSGLLYRNFGIVDYANMRR